MHALLHATFQRASFAFVSFKFSAVQARNAIGFYLCSSSGLALIRAASTGKHASCPDAFQSRPSVPWSTKLCLLLLCHSQRRIFASGQKAFVRTGQCRKAPLLVWDSVSMSQLARLSGVHEHAVAA
eukprot:5123045-Pleurochrysis_carterae.AAC.1